MSCTWKSMIRTVCSYDTVICGKVVLATMQRGLVQEGGPCSCRVIGTADGSSWLGRGASMRLLATVRGLAQTSVETERCGHRQLECAALTALRSVGG